MSVFKSELNWSTYQDKQMKVLESIGKSLDITEKRLDTSFSRLETILSFIGKASEVNAKNIASMTKEWTGTFVDLDTSYRDVIEANRRFVYHSNNAGKGLDDLGNKSRKAGDALVSGFSTIVSRLYNRLGGLEGIGRKADNFSSMSDQMIKISGMSGSAVREFRSEIMSVVKDLNLKTGGLYSPSEAYSRVISASQDITSNLDAITEMSRPLLLSYETLDVNIHTVSELFNKFYTRYTFSSKNMESTLDEIRGNTAGNSANAEATFANIKSLESWISNYAGNDNTLREELLEKISHYTSWIESMDLDSGAFTSYLNSIAYGDWSDNKELLNILNRSGIGAIQATDMARSGMYEELTQGIMDGVYDIMKQFDTNGDLKLGESEIYSLGKTLDNYGISRELAMEIWNTKNSGGYQSLDDFINNQSKNPSTMEKLAENKYVSATDKISHWVEGIYNIIAKWQEHLGFGLSDVASAVYLTKGLFGSRGGGSTVGNLSLNSLKSIGANSTLKGVITSNGLGSAGIAASDGLGKVAALGGGLGGAAMLAGGVAAGGALTYGGIKGMLDDEKTTGYRVGSGVQTALGVGGAGALVALGVTNPVGWVALAAGGLVALGKSAYENAHELSGNAKEVQNNIKSIEDSLKQENADRLSRISDLNYRFKQENDIVEQRRLLEESGLFNTEDLQDKSEAQLQSMIDSYINAASAMDNVTDEVLKTADRYYTGQEDDQQKGFIDSLKDADLSEDQMKNVVSLLKNSVSDEDLLNKFDKYLKDDKITKSEFNDLLYGGKNAWFDKVNLQDKGLDVSGMKLAAGYLGWDMDFVDSSNASSVATLYNNYANSITSEDREKAYKAIEDSGLEDEIRKVYGDEPFTVFGYDTGSNYIPHNQLAYLHEGEAVVPKKYNPAANNAELERAIEYLESSQSINSRETGQYFSSFLDELVEIKEFLEEWKEYNTRKEKMSEIRSRFSTLRGFTTTYMKGST